MGNKSQVWKKYQKDQKEKSKIKLAVIALLGLVILIIIAKILNLLVSFNQPFDPNLVDSQKFHWDGVSAINIIFVQNPDKNPQSTLVNFQPKTKKINVLHLSNQIYLELPKNYGSWQLGSIYRLGQEEEKGEGARLLKYSLSKLTGLPIDSIIILNSSDPKYHQVEDILIGLYKNPVKLISFLTSIKTDLTSQDLIRFIWQASKVRYDKVLSLNIAQSDITESKLLPDSSRVLGVNNVKLDVFIRDKLSDATISEEQTPVAIFNATDHPNLAMEVSRIITNLGGNVIITGNTDHLNQNSSVIISPNHSKKDNLTSQRLTQIFAPGCATGRGCKSQDSQVLSSRAQVNVVIGEDYFKFWYQH